MRDGETAALVLLAGAAAYLIANKPSYLITALKILCPRSKRLGPGEGENE